MLPRYLTRVTIIALLVIVNIALFFSSRSAPPAKLQTDQAKTFSPIISSPTTLRKLEVKPKVSSGNQSIEFESYGTDYCVAYNVTKGRGLFKEDGLEPITLCSHTTSIYIKEVMEQVANWDGPISLALYIDRYSLNTVQFFLDVHACDKKFAEKVSLHVVYRMTALQGSCGQMTVRAPNCTSINSKYINKFASQTSIPFGIYPINVVRNIARKGAPSHFQIISDVEMIFSEKFALQAKTIINKYLRNDTKKLVVIRRFELENKIKKVPMNHLELKKRIDAKEAFEFHHKIFPAGHTIEALWHWFRLSKKYPNVTMWEIPYKGPSWEPQVIMHSSAPMSEEFIPTRIRDQQALIYELCRANYSFYLASHLFNVHRGVKRQMTNLDVAVKNHQQKLKSKAFNPFLQRIDKEYPATKERCKKFTM